MREKRERKKRKKEKGGGGNSRKWHECAVFSAIRRELNGFVLKNNYST